MYNPSEDRSAEILTNANNRAAEIQLAGMQNLGNAFANLGESAAKAYEQAGKNKMTSDYLQGMAVHLSNIKRPESDETYITAEDMKNISKGSLGTQQAIVSSAQALYEHDLAMERMNAQYGAALNLAQEKQRLGLTGGSRQSDPKMDANYGRQFYMGLVNSGLTHEDALKEMDSAGMGWAKQYIVQQQNGFFPTTK